MIPELLDVQIFVAKTLSRKIEDVHPDTVIGQIHGVRRVFRSEFKVWIGKDKGLTITRAHSQIVRLKRAKKKRFRSRSRGRQIAEQHPAT